MTLIKTAAPIGREPLDEKGMLNKYADRIRHGKTAKDKAGGFHKRNAERKLARAEWQRDSRATHATFPV